MSEIITTSGPTINIARTVYDVDVANTISLVSCLVTEVNGSAPGGQPAWFTNAGLGAQVTENGRAKCVHTATVNVDDARAASVAAFKYQVVVSDGSNSTSRTFTVQIDATAFSGAGAAKLFFCAGANILFSYDLKASPPPSVVTEISGLSPAPTSIALYADRTNLRLYGNHATASTTLGHRGLNAMGTVTQLDAQVPAAIYVVENTATIYYRVGATYYRINADGSGKTTLGTGFSAGRFVVDEPNNYLYESSGSGSPYVVRRRIITDWSNTSDIITLTSTTHTQDVTADFARGYLVVSRRSSSPAAFREFWRYNLDGSNGVMLHSDSDITVSGHGPVRSIVLDTVTGELYWVSGGVKKIKKISYLGAGPWTPADVLTHADQPYGIALLVNPS